MLLHFVSGIIIFGIRLSCALLPYFYLLRRGHNEDKRIFSLSICNCIACGIFLSVCFFGLIPHVHREEDVIRTNWNASTNGEITKRDIFLSTELMVMLGFLMMLIIEQVALSCCSAQLNAKTSPAGVNAPPSLRSLLEGEAEDGQPLVDTTLDDHDDGMQDIVFRSASPVEHSSHSRLLHISPPQEGISARTLFLLFGLSTHSLFEGVALGVQHEKREFMNLVFAIMIHEVLCCMAYGIAMAQQFTPLRPAFFTAVILASSIPTGMVGATLLSHFHSDSLLLRFVLEGMAAGAFVYAACVQMLSAELKSSSSHRVPDCHDSQDSHTQPPSPHQGLIKATAVTFGVFLFWSFKLASGGHH